MKRLILFLFGSLAIMAGGIACSASEDSAATPPDATAPAANEPDPMPMDTAPGDTPGMTDPGSMQTESPLTPGSSTDPSMMGMSDAQIEAAVQANLQAQYPDSRFEVASENGNVTVKSDAVSPSSEEGIREQVNQVPGVNQVEVQISPTPATPTPAM